MITEKLIVGNWKMNGLRSSLVEVDAMPKALDGVDTGKVKVAICPPFTLLSAVQALIGGSMLGLGGQDCHLNGHGAHTGDVSALMLKDLGAEYVIIGHSERRTDHQETDDLVAKKAKAAIEAGLLPIICVGESEAQRDSGQAEAIVLNQVKLSIPDGVGADQIAIAYEPVWAIGTGRVPKTSDVEQMHAAIRGVLSSRFNDEPASKISLLYGGSVNPKNADELLAIPNVDGALVGGASLTAQNFMGIVATQL